MSKELEAILAYHEASKHNFGAYSPGPRRLDMETKPDLFLRYVGAPLLKLDTGSAGAVKENFPDYEQVFIPGEIPPEPLDRKSISRLFFDSLAISVWKKTGFAKWPLRVNPSSGNLHPTEGYLISGPVEGLLKKPAVCHYSPLEHALELRAEFSPETWELLSSGFPEGTVFAGLSSIHWRVAWKYGIRAFRYSNHDIGHAVGALGFAAAGLGWEAKLLEDMGSEEIASLLGISGSTGPEKEEPACLLAIFPSGKGLRRNKINSAALPAFEKLSWKGYPSRLSPKHVKWVEIERAILASRKEKTDFFREFRQEAEVGKKIEVEIIAEKEKEMEKKFGGVSLSRVIRSRRSALEMNNSAYMEKETFYGMLRRTLWDPAVPPFNTLAFGPFAHLLIFVNRVKGLLPGLYIFLRKPGEQGKLKATMRGDFLWERPENCPPDLEFYMLVEESLYYFAAQLSCAQRKAADACFTVCMISEFEAPLRKFGSWLYPYLFWECGILGQLLYLEAEARGFRGCGIGCFFDNPLHETLGLEGHEYQDLYHFAVGVSLPEKGVSSLPAYPDDKGK
ncbi:SagB/ThcOx family dehydrogenase [Methanosarcina sp. Mfa9]|uniref:SagB/ThcOx family dehydrogenase n=1 Tax=Methanosarcina sp. Mfa9 TaxID=3439063 RepID=UPI003F85F53E